MSTGLRRNRLAVLLAACALIALSAVYSAHGLGDRAHGHAHCDLCVHFSGTAGSPAHATVVGKPPLVVRTLVLPPHTVFATRSPLGEHLPRGPPLSNALI